VTLSAGSDTFALQIIAASLRIGRRFLPLARDLEAQQQVSRTAVAIS
jgi:hypothetical protein